MTRTTPHPELWNPETYDALRRQLIPSFDLLYAGAAEVVAAGVAPDAGILDLGAGTGLLSATVRRRLPRARLTLVDHSDKMLDQARARFAGDGLVTLRVADLTEPLEGGPFEAVVSGLAIHHLAHEEKQRLFRRIRNVLRPGGVFVNVEQILAPFPLLESLYDAQHERHVVASETPPDEWAAGRERMKHDICADLETQLRWLRQAGFDQVDCLVKDWRFATYAGWARE
ncbi:class I SAM-dependent methyltransferase [Nonomuraea glycinis]|uniref:class I SAM-dependent methyltransferase n=1 Tax=Nonomuraea glycinis TaxID=2047744 RepID=UPI002E15AFEE|nr:class I SAM-dependent methyltransferase [Nonomuraea glycinis]